jgi:hypothetical protein
LIFGKITIYHLGLALDLKEHHRGEVVHALTVRWLVKTRLLDFATRKTRHLKILVAVFAAVAEFEICDGANFEVDFFPTQAVGLAVVEHELLQIYRRGVQLMQGHRLAVEAEVRRRIR